VTNDQYPDDPHAEAVVKQALDVLGTADPPPGFVGRVMWRTKHQINRDQRRGTLRAGDTIHMAKKALLGLAAVAAIALAVLYLRGFPAVDQTEGTIGAAQRYRAEQVRQSDVKVVNPELQAFMQTDVFDRLIRDKQAVAALASPAVQQAMASPAFAEALASPAFQQALASPEVQQALASPEVASALASPSVQQVMASPAFQVSLNAQGVQAAMASPAFQQAMASPAVQQALASPAFQEAMANPAFQQVMASPALQQAMVSPAFQEAMASPAFQAALSSPAFQQVMASPAFQQGLSAQGFTQELSLQAQALAANGLSATGASGER
jgi:hypothetical protein